jgi:hypothetical protein
MDVDLEQEEDPFEGLEEFELNMQEEGPGVGGWVGGWGGWGEGGGVDTGSTCVHASMGGGGGGGC